jgi:hypothetical protein
VTFNHIAFGNGIMAVVAGLLADFVARWLKFGPVSPFILAVPVLVMVSLLVTLLWTENKSTQQEEVNLEELKMSFKESFKSITPDVFMIGVIESVFESSLFVFVFIWTPAISGTLKFPTTVKKLVASQGLHIGDVPLGVAFATFMVCLILGGVIYNYLKQLWKRPLYDILLPVIGASALLFFVNSYLSIDNPNSLYRTLILICLQLVEFGCGFYFPIMRSLRDKYLPEENRFPVIVVFRIPLVVLSSLALLTLHDSTGGIPHIFIYCGVLMMVASVCSIKFATSSCRGKVDGVESVNEDVENV